MTETEPDAEQADAPEPEADDETEPVRSGTSRPLIVVAAALLVVATFLGVLAARYHAQLTHERDERQAVEEVAARFSTAFLSYDYRSLDATLDRVLRDASRRYGGEYEKLFKTSLSALLQTIKARSVGTVTDVFLGSIDDETASVLTVANVQREGIAGREPLAGQYLQLDLVKQGGAWRVDNVLTVDLTQSAGPAPGADAPAAPAATTTTSVPK